MPLATGASYSTIIVESAVLLFSGTCRSVRSILELIFQGIGCWDWGFHMAMSRARRWAARILIVPLVALAVVPTVIGSAAADPVASTTVAWGYRGEALWATEPRSDGRHR